MVTLKMHKRKTYIVTFESEKEATRFMTEEANRDAACFFNETKGYLAIGAGVPIGFYLIQMLSNMGEKLDCMKYLTLYSLFPGEEIISGSGGVFASNLILIGLGICLYALGVIKFIKKDLCL